MVWFCVCLIQAQLGSTNAPLWVLYFFYYHCCFGDLSMLMHIATVNFLFRYVELCLTCLKETNTWVSGI